MLGFTMALSNLAGKSWAAPLLAEIHPLATSQGTGILRLNLADFSALNQPLGSLRIGTSPMQLDGKKQLGLFAPILINRGPNMELYVMSAECTHEGCSVPTFQPQVGVMVCPCHGSQYQIDGTVVQGPALQNLRQFNFRNQKDVLEIEIPDLFFQISAKPANTSAPRLEFTFLGFSSITYEFFFRDSLASSPSPLAFSSTPDGPLVENSIDGIDDYLSVYLPRPNAFGFYELAMKSQPV